MSRKGFALGAAGVAILWFATTAAHPATWTSDRVPVSGTTPPIGDACLVGRWVEQSYFAPGNWTWPDAGGPAGPPVIAATGLEGLVITYSANGTETEDFSAAQPVVGYYQGQQLKVTIRGRVAFAVRADGHVAVPTGAVNGQVTGAFYVDGVFDPNGTVSAGSGAYQYVCAGNKLHLESQALHAGYGPEQDDLTRVALTSADQSVTSSVGSSLPTPSAILRDPVALLVNALITLALVLLVTFPSHLFNRTYEENHDTIERWWTSRLPWLQRLQKGARDRFRTRYRAAASYAAVVLAGGVLAALLDPRFGLNPRTLALFAGAALALTAGTVVAAIAAGAYRMARHKAGSWQLHALPTGLLVAALCVLVSRLASFQPGYLYGLIGGVTFSAALSLREEAHTVAVTSLVTLVVSITAWLLWVPVSTASAADPTAFGWALLSNFLAALFISGIVGLLIGLVPLRFLPGEKLAKWHRGAWGMIFGLAGLALFEIMLRPQSAGSHVASVPFWTTVGLFVAFGAASVLFWGYFKMRKNAGQAEPA